MQGEVMNRRTVLAGRKLIGPALLAGAMLAGPASAKDAAVWFSYVDAQAAAVGFATPDSGDVRFVLYCEHAGRNVSVTVNQSPGVNLNQPVIIELSAGAAKVSLTGVAVADKNEGYLYGEANNVAVASVTEVLRAPGPLKAKMAGKSYAFPEKGRAKHLKVFEDGCKAK
jgi:hypothetical protein